MLDVFAYVLLSVLVVSLISLIGVFTLSVKVSKLKPVLMYLVAFSAGALLGDAFLHLFPEIIEATGELTPRISLLVLGGIMSFFIVEKLIHWQHCHTPITEGHIHPFAKMNLLGDGVHNFLDGIIIGASYLVSLPAGIATTIAVALHEIPQEIGDFGILVHGGFSTSRALLVNLLTALTAVVGAVLAFFAGNFVPHIEQIVIPLAIGGFIYIAASDLIPELHKEFSVKTALLQLLAFAAGIAVMVALLGLE